MLTLAAWQSHDEVLVRMGFSSERGLARCREARLELSLLRYFAGDAPGAQEALRAHLELAGFGAGHPTLQQGGPGSAARAADAAEQLGVYAAKLRLVAAQ